MSTKPPRGMRLVITLVGRRNAGKSSLVNAISGQEIAIVSDTPGTTTDPVAKQYELLPLGPVTFYDTAGLDDEGELGAMRMKATRKTLWRSDVALVVVGDEISDHEQELIEEIRSLEIPFLVVFNKADLRQEPARGMELCGEGIHCMEVSAATGKNIKELKEAVIDLAPEELKRDPALVGDLISEGDWVVCVVPIDLAAPKGRLILPQVQVLREILDCDAIGVTVKERELEEALGNLRRDPALVITDSQVVLEVAGDVPENVPLTTFSTLFARFKGDINNLAAGAGAVDSLKDGDTVLVAEACSHHPVADDIGRVKIPRWMSRYTGKQLNYETYAGHDFPDDLERFSLVVHCGGCMLNRMEMMRRIRECERRGVPVTNYGIVISKLQGLMERVLAPLGL